MWRGQRFEFGKSEVIRICGMELLKNRKEAPHISGGVCLSLHPNTKVFTCAERTHDQAGGEKNWVC